MANKYEIHTRKQHAKKGKSGWAGPDTYVAVTVMPEGVSLPSYALRRKSIENLGGRLIFIGEGYSGHFGPKSALGRAIAKAEAFVMEQGGAL